MSLRTFCLATVLSVLASPLILAAVPTLHLAYGNKQVDLTPEKFAQLKPTSLEAHDHDRIHSFRGVTVHDLLRLVDAPPGEKLRRPTLSLVVRVKGADGFVCAFALAEFEEGFTERTILLASEEDGMPLPATLGPWRLIVPKDTRLSRWVRQVVSLEVLTIDDSPNGAAAGQPEQAAERANDHVKFAPK